MIWTNVKVPNKKKKKLITQDGPLLITHHGISGPAALRLSAFAAREFHECHYQTSDVVINWIPLLFSSLETQTNNMGGSGGGKRGDGRGRKKASNPQAELEILQELLWDQTFQTPKRSISSSSPFYLMQDSSSNTSNNPTMKVGIYSDLPTSMDSLEGEKVPLIPKRLWSAMISHSGLDKPGLTWADAPKKKIFTLARNLQQFEFKVSGKGVFKDEFVTAGGISCKEIQINQNMESKKCPGLFCCGEVLDIDGITGGFNFMNCWSTGYMAGKGAVEYILRQKDDEEEKDD